MLVASRWIHLLAALVLLTSAADRLVAAPASDVILPSSTKAYVSVARAAEFQQRWEKTQIGQLLNDEIMQPFIDDAKDQIADKYPAVEEKLGITWDDLDGISAGEMSLALLERKELDAALAITIDVTGQEQKAAALLVAIEKRFTARGARKEVVDKAGTSLTVFTMNASDEARKPQVQTTVYFTKDNILCGVDDRAEAEAMLARFAANPTNNLQSVAGYKATMERCQREAKDLAPEARWYVDPFGFVFAARTLEKQSLRRYEQDVAIILYKNGFNAIQAAGGFINLLVDDIEILDRTAIYAPPAPGKENDPLRWNLSMQMLQLPNAESLAPQSWVPRMSANYTSFQIDLLAAFDNVGPLFDDMQDHDGAWKNSLAAWRDPFGQNVDVREEFIKNMGQRITLVTDYDLPITVDSERSLFAIEARNESALAETLKKWMSKEPGVERRDVGDYVIWERVAADHVEPLEIKAPGFTSIQPSTDEEADEDDQRERVLPNSAVTVALGHMFMASDIGYLKEILAGFGQRDMLASSSDYQQVADVLGRTAPGQYSVFAFGRTDEEVRPTYELIRQGKMPEAKTMLGKALNNLLTTEVERSEGVLRKQRVDGSSLPSFEAVRRYFGPAGHVVRSEPDGWFATGVLLNKEAP